MSTSEPRPLDALHEAMTAHGKAQSALWDEIDNAVSAAAAELDAERQAGDITTGTAEDEHGQPTA